ncbi:MAG: AAA family ATPase [Candidatus Obscuribacterales bacterium]|nr:AAA family ATPase [Steroidobacteraceae bacterium]
MYLELFKLRELPFRLSPDPAFLYLSKHHARAKAYMESTIWFTDGFVVITGEIGSGKTTLIETFLKELEKDVVVAQINQTQVTAVEFLQTVLVQFGFQPFKMKKAELLATLNNFLIEQYAAGRRVVLIVDEAQNLSNKVLEEVRMLSGVETTKDKVLRIILAGQPELNEKLNSPELIQLSQRIRLRFHLTPLSKADTTAYIQHRLEVAGSQGREIFAEDCFAVIFRYSGGIPRLVNTLCDTAMLVAFAQDHSEIKLEHIQAAIEELRWVEYAERSVRLPSLGARETESNLDSTAARQWVLGRVILATGGETVAERPLTPGRLIIGRTPDNDLQIDSKYISRHHAQIVTTLQSSILEDLNSTNGVYIRSKRARRRVLNDGDVIQIGQHEIMYIDERQNRIRHSDTALDDDDAVPLLDQTIINDIAEPLEHEETQVQDT